MGAILCGGALAQQETPAVSKGQPVAELGNENAASNSQDDPKEEKTYPPELLRALEGIQSAIHSLVPEKDEAGRQRHEQREYADLEAQESMAWATYWLMWIGGGGLLLTVVGVVLLAGTLVYTRRAAKAATDTVDEARKATTAAIAANETSREIGKLQIRAYLNIYDIEFLILHNESVNIKFKLANTGNSPAKDVKIAFDYYTRDAMDLINKTERKKSNITKYIDDTHAGETERIVKLTLKGKTRLIDTERFKDINCSFLWFIGQIKYIDVFGEERIENIAHCSMLGKHMDFKNPVKLSNGPGFGREEFELLK